MELSEEIINTLEDNNFDCGTVREQGSQYHVEIEQYTPEGEDWHEIIQFDGTDTGFIEAIKQRYQYFDVDEEIEMLILSRGENGIPSSIKALVKDAEWKVTTLAGLLDDLLRNCIEDQNKPIPTIKVRVVGEMEIEVGEEMESWPEEDLIQWGYDYLRNSNKTEFDFDEDQHVEIIWR